MFRWKKPFLSLASALLALTIGVAGAAPNAAAEPAGIKHAYLPLVAMPAATATPACPTSSGESYASGGAAQWDRDNPVRPAPLHADKNLALRGYTSTNAPKGLVNYGSDDPNQPPQFATLFNPSRLPTFSSTYRANQWNWAPSPTPVGYWGGPTRAAPPGVTPPAAAPQGSRPAGDCPPFPFVDGLRRAVDFAVGRRCFDSPP